MRVLDVDGFGKINFAMGTFLLLLDSFKNDIDQL